MAGTSFSGPGVKFGPCPENLAFFRPNPKPVQLTFSPLAMTSPMPSADGRKLFVVGRTYSGEAMRYDAKAGQFVPFLGGISAECTFPFQRTASGWLMLLTRTVLFGAARRMEANACN